MHVHTWSNGRFIALVFHIDTPLRFHKLGSFDLEGRRDKPAFFLTHT
jgi:hypothetical protein